MSLRGRLDTCGGIDARADVLTLLKTELQSARTDLQNKFESGEINGLKAAAQIAKLHDDILVPLFEYTNEALFPADTEQLSLCAVGGYGRGEMAPFSDLDLLFLCTDKKDEARCASVAEYVLYMLWDLGLKVGHSNRNPAQCMELARQDETVLTSLLDLRLLAGPAAPPKSLVALVNKERTRAKKRAFIAAKLGARDGRHAKAGNSRYVIEPNVKEGKGGLRDLHVLYWVSKFLQGQESKHAPRKPHNVAAYLRLGLLDTQASKRFGTAAEFLWNVRIHLHFLAGRACELLSFDHQDGLAKRMGYSQKYPEERVEAFMRNYFTITREVGALTRIACAKLEAESALLLPQGLDRFIPTARRGLKEKGFVLEHGRLNFADGAGPKKSPLLILHLFRIAGARNLDIHPNAFAALSQNMALIDDAYRSNKEAASIFFDILLKSKAPGALLRTMNEAGVLGAYLPEFGAIVGRTQFNMHHAYTVDDHTISLVRDLHDIEKGKLTREHPLASAFVKTWDTRLRLIVYLACLLHDAGKSEGDQCEDGARMATVACLRLGLPDADVETISWLVRHHLDMSETAQRRDISDAVTIEKFARTIGSITRLQMLCALTIVDIRAVGPGIWNDWKGELLRELYEGTRQVLMGTKSSEPKTVSEIDALLSLLPSEATNATHYVKASADLSKDITALYVVSRDRAHLFADLAGAIASSGANVAGAQLHTGDDGRVFNTFYLQNTEGLAFGRKNPQRLSALEAVTLSAAKGEVTEFNLPASLPSRRAAAIPIKARTSIIRDKDSVIIEVEGRDRIGLLYALAKTLAAHKLSVRSAHIDVAGPKAVDVFYVIGAKATSLRQSSLSADLLGVLETKMAVDA